jgi:hypothetical protein
MAGTTTTPTFSDRVLSDYIEVVVNNKSQAAVARDTDRAAGTVSANVNRVKKAVADGYIVPGVDANGGDAPTVIPTVDRESIADNMLPVVGPALVARMDRMTDERDKIAAKIRTLTGDIEKVEEGIGKVRDAAEGVGFDFDAFDTAVADATAPAPDADATGDDDGDDDDNADDTGDDK